MSCEERAWLTNQPGVSSCTHVFVSGFGRPQLRSRVKEARPLYFAAIKVRTIVVARSDERDLRDEMFSKMCHKYFGGNVIECGGEGGR